MQRIGMVCVGLVLCSALVWMWMTRDVRQNPQLDRLPDEQADLGAEVDKDAGKELQERSPQEFKDFSQTESGEEEEAKESEKETPPPEAPLADVQKLAVGNNRFASDLYVEIAKRKKGNLFFSPLSIRTALAMAYAGAANQTAEAMKTALHFDLAEPQLHAAFATTGHRLEKSGVTLRIANRLWGQSGYDFLNPFVETNRRYYGGGLERVDFATDPDAAGQRINAWIEEKTERKIKNVIPAGSLPKATRLVLVNAIYFYGLWQVPFDKKETEALPFFTTPKVSKPVPMMKSGEHGMKKLLKTRSSRVLALPYREDRCAMAIFLPNKKDGLPAMEAGLLRGDTLTRSLQALETSSYTEVSVVLPKWEVTWGAKDLKPALDALGMKTAFESTSADFRRINGIAPPDERALYVESVFHKAFVAVDEKGTEAAAATVGPIPAAEPIDITPEQFIADHPFLYVIYDIETKAVLFMGRVVDPGKGE